MHCSFLWYDLNHLPHVECCNELWLYRKVNFFLNWYNTTSNGILFFWFVASAIRVVLRRFFCSSFIIFLCHQRTNMELFYKSIILSWHCNLFPTESRHFHLVLQFICNRERVGYGRESLRKFQHRYETFLSAFLLEKYI